MENNRDNTPLWFIGGLLVGASPLIPAIFMTIGIISIVAVFTISSIFSALAYAAIIHWKTFLLFVIFGSVFALLGYMYMREEMKKRESKG